MSKLNIYKNFLGFNLYSPTFGYTYIYYLLFNGVP